jgi:hypothetical protein
VAESGIGRCRYLDVDCKETGRLDGDDHDYSAQAPARPQDNLDSLSEVDDGIDHDREACTGQVSDDQGGGSAGSHAYGGAHHHAHEGGGTGGSAS